MRKMPFLLLLLLLLLQTWLYTQKIISVSFLKVFQQCIFFTWFLSFLTSEVILSLDFYLIHGQTHTVLLLCVNCDSQSPLCLQGT